MRRTIRGVAVTVFLTTLVACSARAPEPKNDIAQLIEECGDGDGSACYVLGLEFDTKTPEERARAVLYYQRAAVLLEPECTDEAQACLWLGDMHHWGQGMNFNEVTANNYYQRGIKLLDQDCTEKIDDACMHLNAIYKIGSGVTADPVKARTYYLKAMRIWCDNDYTKACTELKTSNSIKEE